MPSDRVIVLIAQLTGLKVFSVVRLMVAMGLRHDLRRAMMWRPRVRVEGSDAMDDGAGSRRAWREPGAGE